LNILDSLKNLCRLDERFAKGTRKPHIMLSDND